MNTATQILPGVRALAWIVCDALPERVDLLAASGVAVGVMTELHRIDFFGSPECSLSRKREEAGVLETATLKFQCARRVPDWVRTGFVVTDMLGRTWLIGSREDPLPTLEYEAEAGAPGGGAAVFSYEVKHTALRTLVPCVAVDAAD